ncbi:hypothetical protein [Halorussus lipolyticus]|uniref:hypothetical protein n=1 Tax=Halorussus lipolyticus TaxID=3034024 RepID=UPI0023E7970A|nr:hypothetical protein [Halorussus sp. DT80]
MGDRGVQAMLLASALETVVADRAERLGRRTRRNDSGRDCRQHEKDDRKLHDGPAGREGAPDDRDGASHAEVCSRRW